MTQKELEHIQKHIPDSKNLISHVGSRSMPTSIEKVLSDIQQSSIVHFGCHAMQHPSKPLESALLLGDGPLTVSRLIHECQTSAASLVYLSACQTATGDHEQPDESLSLASTMMFAGFKGVVGTMWYVLLLDD